jgi:hypothetical protein
VTKIETIVDQILDGYLEAALFSSDDDNGDPLDSNYDSGNFSPITVEDAKDDCEKLAELMESATTADNREMLQAALDAQSAEQIGHDFWLTRNHHGSGFWDGDYEDFGDQITHLVAEHFHELHVYADGNELWIERG